MPPPYHGWIESSQRGYVFANGAVSAAQQQHTTQIAEKAIVDRKSGGWKPIVSATSSLSEGLYLQTTTRAEEG